MFLRLTGAPLCDRLAGWRNTGWRSGPSDEQMYRSLTHTHAQVQPHTHRDAWQASAEKSGDDLGGDEQQLVADAGAPVLVL